MISRKPRGRLQESLLVGSGHDWSSAPPLECDYSRLDVVSSSWSDDRVCFSPKIPTSASLQMKLSRAKKGVFLQVWLIKSAFPVFYFV